MDKNTIIGLLLILLILVGYSYFTRPTPEEIEAQRRHNDSIAAIQQSMESEIIDSQGQTQANKIADENLQDSALQQKLYNAYGGFASSIHGEEQLITLENKYLKIVLTSKGGRIYSALLKDYSNYKNDSLSLFSGNESSFNLVFYTQNNHQINTSDFFFDAIQNSDRQATLRLKAGETGYLDFVYTLHPDDYMVDFEVLCQNMENELSQAWTLDLQWTQKIRQQENGRKYEDRYAYLCYKYLSDDMEHLSETKDDIKNIVNKVKWIGYKDQFFSSVLIAKESFESTKLESSYFAESDYLKEYKTTLDRIPFFNNSPEGLKFNYYFGPNDYSLLKKYDKTKFEGQNLELEKLVPLGWSLFRYVNKWLVIPIFDWLTSWCASLGLAILLLTLIIKTALFPLVYKSFMSSAKMRVLRPQIEQITAKYPGQENAMTRQQKNMELYRQVGINPMAGCVPMLLQMPFLFALFMFFPSAIELRHQSFLWASDLSTYDAVIQWDANIPFVTSFFGNHVSIFCLLMTVTNIFYTKYNMEQTSTGQEQIPGMKIMMYFMPVFMLVFLNSYPAGLNYYYCISTLITILQTIAFRFFLNEEKLLAKLEANKSKSKPTKKKSGFMARLEEMQRKQQAMMKEQQKNKKR